MTPIIKLDEGLGRPFLTSSQFHFVQIAESLLPQSLHDISKISDWHLNTNWIIDDTLHCYLVDTFSDMEFCEEDTNIIKDSIICYSLHRKSTSDFSVQIIGNAQWRGINASERFYIKDLTQAIDLFSRFTKNPFPNSGSIQESIQIAAILSEKINPILGSLISQLQEHEAVLKANTASQQKLRQEIRRIQENRWDDPDLKRFTIEEIAEIFHVTPREIYRWENCEIKNKWGYRKELRTDPRFRHELKTLTLLASYFFKIRKDWKDKGRIWRFKLCTFREVFARFDSTMPRDGFTKVYPGHSQKIFDALDELQ